jgi:class 3 adenylate cyclase/tetratricopeptide (TPR) repeat protein
MRCPECRREVPGGARFCAACGSPLVVACGKCGSENAPGGHHCDHCGQALAGTREVGWDAGRFGSPRSYTPRYLAEKILTSRSAIDGERKLVTVLFADVVGFTGLAERLDPEEVHSLMIRAFEVMLDEVHRYEGTVNQFLGDGIMALFGAPIGHEDHAERAVYAAMGIRKALEVLPGAGLSGTRLTVRQGLNTGTVVVGSIGTDLRMDYTAVGDTTNVAARLQQVAEPGRILISEATYRVVSGYVHTRPLGRLALKGKSEPIGGWEIISKRAPRTRLEVRAEGGLTPFVGRGREMRTLFERFEEAKAGNGQVVLVTGEPGIGKSRLLTEFRRRLTDDFTWLEGHCISFVRSSPFSPMIDLLKRNFHIEEEDAEAAVDAKIQRGVVLLGEDLRPTLPYFRSLLSVDPCDETVRAMDPRQRRAGIFGAVRTLMERASEVRPQILVLEDLQWMDKATEEYVVFAADSVATHRVLCILSYRTGYSPPLGERSYCTCVALDALSADHSAQMASALLGEPNLPSNLKGAVMEKTEGNPFFVEEVVRSLREQGVIAEVGGRYEISRRLDEMTVPATIQDVIAARIDRLDENAKCTLQTGAVIGREFKLALLEETIEARGEFQLQVDQLKRLEFIHETGSFPEISYRFCHSLAQEVAYESLLMQTRQELHGIVARLLERSARDRVAEQYSLLAHHYTRARDGKKAVEYLVKAGDRAVSLYANADAVTYYTDALAQLERQGPSVEHAERRIDIVMRLCGVSGSLVDFERDLRNLAQALQLAREINDCRRESQVLYWTGRTHYLTGHPASGIEQVEKALALADELGEDSLAAMPLNLLGRLYFLQSEFRKNIQALERSARLLERDRNHIELATAWSGLGWSLAMIGEFDRALREADRGIALAQEIMHLPTEAACRMYRACAWSLRGEWRHAVDDIRQARAIGDRTGDAFRVYLTTAFLGGFLVMSGEVEEGVSLLEETLQAAERLRTTQGLAMFRVFLAEGNLARGRRAEADHQCREAITLAQKQGDRWCEAWARRVLGQALASGGTPDLAAAEEEVLEAARVQRVIGTRPDLARTLLTHGRILQARGEEYRARQVLTEAKRMLEELGMIGEIPRVELTGS